MNSNIISQNRSGNSDQKLTYNSQNHRDSNRYETLKEAILHKDRGTIIWLINEGCPVNDEQVDLVARSDTPLHLAVFTNDFYTVSILITAGAKVNAVNFHKQTPLHLAFEMGNMKMVDLLLAECTDGRVNPFTNYGLSHFHIACVRNNWRIVSSYLESGVNANIYLEKSFYGKDYVYYRPLHLAVKYQNLEVAELLLKCGANVNAKDRYKRSPLHLACSYNHRRICEAIRDPGVKENTGDVLSRIRSENQVQVDIVNLLIKYEADVNALDSNGMPPLVHVFKCNYREIKNTIREKVNTEDENFWKEAIEVFKDVQRSKFYVLLQHGVSTRFCNDTKDTLLHMIIDGKKLFSSGSHTMIPKEQGLSDEEKAELVDLLLTYGTDVEAKNSRGQTALQMAISMYQVKTVKILLKRQACVKNICFFHYKIPKRVPGGSYDLSDMENFLEIVSLILKKKFDLNLNRINELLVLRYMDTENSIQLFENCSTADLKHLLDFGDINTMDLSSYICERTVLTNREKIYLILQHIQKLEIAGLYVNNYIKGEFSKYHCIIDAKQNGSDPAFADQCKEEINKLKEIMIDRYASFYDLLFLNVNEVAVRVKNSYFRNSIRKNCSINFTIYNDIIIKQFVKGIVRSILLSLAKEYLSILIGLEFPDPCSESIISYLTNEDLCNLALAFE